jgi:ribosomal protein S12 methylthiotransferase accessory factor
MKNNLLLNHIPLIVDPTFGVIRSLIEEREIPNYSSAYAYSCILSDTSAFSDSSNFKKSNAVAFDRERAKIKALGEGLERYSSAIYKKDMLICGAWSSLCQEYNIPFLYVPNYNPLGMNQLSVYNEESHIYWTKCFDIIRENDTLMPASLVYLPYKRSFDESIFTQNTSTGLAFYTDYISAVLNAVCEIIERDTFMNYWFIKKPFVKINYDSMPENLRSYVNLFRENMGLGCELYALDSDFGVPVIIAALFSCSKNSPKFVIAASCKLDVEKAILAALEELEQCRRYATYHYAQNTSPALKPEQVQKHEHHILYWSNHENYEQVRFFFEDVSFVDFNQLPSFATLSNIQQLSYLKARIKNLGYDLFVSNITPKDLTTLGVYTVRAWIPQATPLVFGYNYRFVLSEQLKKHYSGNMGEINSLPHFFP